MTWTKLSDDYADRLEDLELTPTACWLHTAALIYCNRVGNDGRLPFSKLGKVASIEGAELFVAELEQQRLWLRVDGIGAWQVDWTDQESAEDVRLRRAGDAERQRRRRQHQAGDHRLCAPDRPCRRVTRDVTGDETRDDGSVEKTRVSSTGVTRDSRRESRPPVPPVPSHPKGGGRGRGRTLRRPRCDVPGHIGPAGLDGEGDPYCEDCADARGREAS